MTKRLQVRLDHDELADIQRLARRQGKTTATWVREALRAARRASPDADAETKRMAIREAMSHAYPAGDISDVLAEIERGYGGIPGIRRRS